MNLSVTYHDKVALRWLAGRLSEWIMVVRQQRTQRSPGDLTADADNVVQLSADEYGNGVVGALNRKGEGRTEARAMRCF